MALVCSVGAFALVACSDPQEEVPADTASSTATATSSPSVTEDGAWTAPHGTPVPKPGWQAVRFFNITVSAPNGLIASPIPMYNGRPAVEIAPWPHDDFRIVLDAETGALIEQAGSEQEISALRPALDTVRVSPFDPRVLRGPTPIRPHHLNATGGGRSNIPGRIPSRASL